MQVDTEYSRFFCFPLSVLGDFVGRGKCLVLNLNTGPLQRDFSDDSMAHPAINKTSQCYQLLRQCIKYLSQQPLEAGSCLIEVLNG